MSTRQSVRQVLQRLETCITFRELDKFLQPFPVAKRGPPLDLITLR